MSRYNAEELQLAIGQEVILVYFKDEIHGTIVGIRNSTNNPGYEMITVKTDDNHTKEAFFIHRIKSVPVLDTLKETKLWKLLYS